MNDFLNQTYKVKFIGYGEVWIFKIVLLRQAYLKKIHVNVES